MKGGKASKLKNKKSKTEKLRMPINPSQNISNVIIIYYDIMLVKFVRELS